MGNIDHAGLDHVVTAAAGIESLQVFTECSGSELVHFARHGQDLVPRCFDGACFMAGHMARFGGHDAFIGLQIGRDDDGVRLGPAFGKIHISAGSPGPGEDFGGCSCCDFVSAIAGTGVHILFFQPFQDLRGTAAVIIVFKE